jgi:MFS transporter, SET family, sugar efflux transporter
MFRCLAQLRKIPDYGGLALAVLLIGLADSTAGPYLALFGANEAGLEPVALGVFLSLISCCGIVLSLLLGRWFDRHPSRWPALVALASGALGYAFLSLSTHYALLAVITGLLGGGMAAFPQLFALAKRSLDRFDEGAAQHGISTLRAIWSLAWAIGPAIGGTLLVQFGFRGLYLTTALCFGLAVLPLLAPRPPVSAYHHSPDLPDGLRAAPRSIWLSVASFTLFHMAMFMGSIALPIHVTRGLHGSEGDVGLMFSLCALLEIPVMLAAGALTQRFGSGLLIRAGFALFVLYFAVATVVVSPAYMLASQLIRAAGIGVVACLGIIHFQTLMPRQIGSATTLYANTASIGMILAGVVSGGWAHFFGYRSVFLLCGALSGVGWALLQINVSARAARQDAGASVKFEKQ